MAMIAAKNNNVYIGRIVWIHLIIIFLYPPVDNYTQGFLDTTYINNITATQESGEKPQSKVWKYLTKWYAAIPVAADGGDAAGSWLWRLDGQTWTKRLFLSSSTSAQADAVIDGDFTHILLYDGQSNSKFITIEFVSGAYGIWASGPGLVSLTLGSGVETATIDIDSNDKIWLAYESDGDINVRWSSSPYSTWSSEIVLETGVDPIDDICSVTAFGGNKIGVLWSNQNDKEFGFAYRNDIDGESTWQTKETADDHNSTVGGGVADDHINFAVHSNGTISAAVKTSYNTVGEPHIALLVRSAGGTWTFTSVRNKAVTSRTPTRPIALLDETEGIITIVYTKKSNDDDIMYKSSSISSLSFFPDEDGIMLLSDTPPPRVE